MAINKLEGWSTEANPEKLYGKEIDACRADGRERLTAILQGCLSGYDSDIDVDEVIRRADDITAAITDATA